MRAKESAPTDRLRRALRRAAPPPAADGTTIAREHVAQFVERVSPFLHVWSHVHVSAVALRVGSQWIGRALAITLEDTPSPRWSEAKTDRLWTGQRCLEIERLPALIKDIAAGRIPAARSPLSKALVLRDGTGLPFKFYSGSRYEAQGRPILENERLLRYTLEWKGETGFATHFESPSAAANWIEDAERDFVVLGHGTLAAVAQRLGVSQDSSQLRWHEVSFLRIIAPVPISFAAIEPSPDRTKIMVQVNRGARILGSEAEVSMEPADAATPNPIFVKLGDATVVEIPPPSSKSAWFQITYCGQQIQRREEDIAPPLRANLRLVALDAFENDEPLFEGGLFQQDRSDKELDSDAFERSVAHLLLLLGFSVFWWGEHRGKGKKVPQGEPDLLAFSADDTLVLVVDSTLRTNATNKSAKLFQRTKQIEAALRAATDAAPRVVPVLAVDAPLEHIASLLRTPSGDSDFIVLAAEHIHDAVEGLRRGLPHREIAKRLPEPFGMGFKTMEPFSLSLNLF